MLLVSYREELKILREKVLHDCPPHEGFWSCHGEVVRNIYELLRTIRSLNDYAFRYHVNLDHNKNDFAKWVRESLKDEELATRLQDIYDQDIYIGIIKRRIKELEEA